MGEMTAMPDSFKETEIGPIPVEWEVVRLGKICKPRKESAHPDDFAAIRYIGLEHIDRGEARLSRWGASGEVKSMKSYFYPGDVLYGKLRPYLDKSALATSEGICSTDIVVLEAHQGLVQPEFLVNLLHTNRFVAFATSTMTGVNHPRTSWAALKEFAVALPSLPEQRRIAHVLSTIQRAIAAQDALIAAAREVKRSLMQRLFTYGPGAEPAPTRETEIGEVPEHWEVVRLGEVCERPTYGYTASAVEESIGPHLLRITDIQNGRVNWSSVPYCGCSDETAQKYKLQPGDILFARIGATTGKSYMVKEAPPAIFASYLIRVRTKPGLYPECLSQFVNSGVYWQQINASKGGRLKQGINIPVLVNLMLPFPSLDEQLAIAHALDTVDRKIEAEEQRKAALQALFKATLHQLMTGQIRV